MISSLVTVKREVEMAGLGNRFKLFFLVNIFIVVVIGSPRVDPLVETDVGLIRGVRADDGDYDMFMGIPYGVVDHNNPFAPSTPYPAFEKVFEANDDSIMCPQLNQTTGALEGVFDCLTLNVYVPRSASSSNQLPVLVWIYGGSYEFGDASRKLYNPKYLVRHDVVFVTLNYRVGPYGFMCLDIPEVPGNSGLKDQRLALRWIKQNIQKFSGNPDSITIMGQSAGATSVDYHLHYSANENLFHRAIMQSGSTQGHLSRIEPNRRSPIIFAEQLGFVTDDLMEAISFLANTDPKLVIDAFKNTVNLMKPCAELDFYDTEKFIHDYGLNAKVPSVKNIPILIGFNDDERFHDYVDKSPEFFEKLDILEELINKYFIFEDEELNRMKEKVAHFYWGDEELSGNIRQQITNFDEDITFVYPVTRNIQKYLDNDATAIYHYLYSYVGPRYMEIAQLNETHNGGAGHSGEIVYLFDRPNLLEPAGVDQLVLDRMTTMWTNFAKYGDPTPETTDLLPVKWEPITHDKFNYLNIDSELTLGQRPFHDRNAFWDVFFEHNEKKQRFYDENKQ